MRQFVQKQRSEVLEESCELLKEVVRLIAYSETTAMNCIPLVMIKMIAYILTIRWADVYKAERELRIGLK